MSRSDDTECRDQVPALAAFFGAEPLERIRMIRRGILVSDAGHILSDLAIGRAATMHALNIRAATMDRARLPPAESERVLGVARLVGQVRTIVEGAGNPQGFDAATWLSGWLSEPLPALGGVRPLELLDTMEGQALLSKTLAHVLGGAYA